MTRILVEHGTVVTAGGSLAADVLIEGDKVAALLAPGTGPPGGEQLRRIDATGKMVTPGIIDPQSVFGLDEVDAVYHVAYDAMAASVARHANPEQADAWREVTGQRRVLSYELLLGTLASW